MVTIEIYIQKYIVRNILNDASYLDRLVLSCYLLDQKTEVGGRRWKSDVRSQRSNDRSQRSEVGRQKKEVR